MKKRVCASFLLIFIFLTSCSSNPPITKDNLNIAITSISGVFNPLMEVSSEDSYINALLFDKLIEIDKQGKPYGNLCQYTTQDNINYTLKLNNVKFTDEGELTADDVLFTINILADPSYMGNYDLSSLQIKGFDEFLNGKAESISGINKIDDKTLTITTTNSNPYFIYGLAIPILSKNYYQQYYTYGNLEKLNEKITPMGTGQYIYVNYEPNSGLTLKSNENYFKGSPKIKNLTIVPTSSDTQMDQIITGNCDLAYIPANVSDMEKIKSNENIKVDFTMENGYGSFGFNCKNELLSIKEIRQAFAHAINREGIIKDVFNEYASTINIPESKSSPYYKEENLKTYSYNLETASKLISDLGFKKNSKGIAEKDGKELSFTFVATTENSLLEVALPVIKDDFLKIGIELNIENVDFNTFVDKLSSGDIDLWFFALGLTANSMEGLSIFTTDSPQNYFAYSNPQFDNVYNKLASAVNENLYDEAYKILNEDLPLIPFYQRQQMLVYNKNIKMVETSSYMNCFSEFYKVGY